MAGRHLGAKAMSFAMQPGNVSALARKVAAQYVRQASSAEALAAELEQRVESLLSQVKSKTDEMGFVKLLYAEITALPQSFLQWFHSTFTTARSTTPRGGKQVKEQTEKLLWVLGPGLAQWKYGNIRQAWETFKPLVPTLVQLFSDAGAVAAGKDVAVRERKTSLATYVNARGLANKTFDQYVAALDALLKNLQGWRKKALQGLQVILSGPENFRGTAAGTYKSAEDKLYIRATPKILKRSAGSYGSPAYILIHELGHRYEYKFRMRTDFDQRAWWTTKYSMEEGEAFAELFALGAMNIRTPGFSAVVDRFEEFMQGNAEQDTSQRKPFRKSEAMNRKQLVHLAYVNVQREKQAAKSLA